MKRFIRKFRRLKEIAAVLTKHELGFLAGWMGLSRPGPEDDTTKKSLPLPTVYERIRMALEELGAAFVKLGQSFSMRADLLPPELIKELEKLQDNVSSVPYDDIKVVVEQELGRKAGVIFQSIEHAPLAAASLGQVHLARLPGGEKVAVKIQRPNIAEEMEADCDIISDITNFLQKYSPWKENYDFIGIGNEFIESLLSELDFYNEGKNADRFRQNFEDDEKVKFPKIYWEYTTRKILVLELIEGTKISNIEELKEREADLKEIAETGTRTYLKQFLEDGFFHGDPHPGNLFYTYDGKLAFIDFGIVGFIDDDLKGKVADLIYAITRKDPQGILNSFFEIGVVPSDVDVRLLKRQISKMVRKYYGISAKDVRAEEIIDDMFTLTTKYKIRVPPDFTLMARTLSILEGIVTKLSPEFVGVEVSRPFLEKLVKERVLSKWDLRQLLENFSDSATALVSLPGHIKYMLERIEEGEIIFKHKPIGLDKYTDQSRRNADKISLAIVVSGLFIGSGLILSTPYLWISITGFVLASVLCIILGVSIIRDKKSSK
ncbi:MAG: AarF/ABC1/UbiB kinase family protein [Chloroflexi bacterium]|nr:AarF/ABC1/UbiB kinase family protein [Chloroflexota bacterium]